LIYDHQPDADARSPPRTRQARASPPFVGHDRPLPPDARANPARHASPKALPVPAPAKPARRTPRLGVFVAIRVLHPMPMDGDDPAEGRPFAGGVSPSFQKSPSRYPRNGSRSGSSSPIARTSSRPRCLAARPSHSFAAATSPIWQA